MGAWNNFYALFLPVEQKKIKIQLVVSLKLHPGWNQDVWLLKWFKFADVCMLYMLSPQIIIDLLPKKVVETMTHLNGYIAFLKSPKDKKEWSRMFIEILLL